MGRAKARPLCQTLGLCKSIALGAALVLLHRAAVVGLFWHFGLVLLVSLAVLSNNRSVRLRHALVGFAVLAICSRSARRKPCFFMLCGVT